MALKRYLVKFIKSEKNGIKNTSSKYSIKLEADVGKICLD